jgi:hypothetical protein
VGDSLARDFAEALGAKDAERLRSLFAPDINFTAMTPSRFWESRDAAQIVDEFMLGTWFDPSDDITAIASIDTETVAQRERVIYQFHVTNSDGRFLVEQIAYVEDNGEQITWLRIMCAGYQPAG